MPFGIDNVLTTTLDVSQAAAEGGAPGKSGPNPGGIPNLAGVRFKIDKSTVGNPAFPVFNFSNTDDPGSSGFEVTILKFRLNTGFLGTGINAHWEQHGGVDGSDEEWFVAGLNKSGPANPGLAWANATADVVDGGGNAATGSFLKIRFRSPGCEFFCTIRATKVR